MFENLANADLFVAEVFLALLLGIAIAGVVMAYFTKKR